MTSPQARRIEAIFLELAELPAEKRAALLDERCGDDREMRAKVERLLAADAANVADGTLGEGVVEFATEHVPKRVGNYAVKGVAGEGGMGAVFDATHASTGRRAAVKLVRAGISTTRGRERMRIEAEMLGRLGHPGIAQVYDAGIAEVEYADGTRSHRPFIAMEFVEGVPVTEFARTRSLSICDKLHLMELVTRAALHAHQRGVIHRDLKPSNVLVTPDGIPKIVDFGIARLIDMTTEGITATGQVLGTVRYMSPEQAAGDPSKVDTRADVYSLGAILYELLAERPVIELGTGSALGALAQLVNARPARLSSVKPELVGDVEAITHKAIERDPDLRYGSAQALADDLDRYLHGRDVTARAPRTIERFVRVVRHNKTISTAVAIAAVAVIASAIVSTWQARVAVRQAHLAQQETIAKTKALDEAHAALNYLTDILASCTPEHDGRDARVLDVALKAASDIEQRFKDQPLVLAGVRLALGRTFLALGRGHEAFKQIDYAFQTRLKLLGEDDRLTVDAEIARNEAALTIGGGVEMSCNYPHPVTWYEQHLGNEARETLRAKMVRAEAHINFSEHTEADALLQSTCDTFRRVYGPEDDDTLDATTNYCFWLSGTRGDPHRAIELLRPIVEIESKKYGANNARTLTSVILLGSALNMVGKGDEGVALLEPAIPTIIDVFGEQHPNPGLAMRTLAGCYRDLGKPGQAQAMFERAISAMVKAWGDADGRTQTTRIRLCELWLDQGRVEEADKLSHDILDKEVWGEVGSPHCAVALDLQGRILLLRHQPADAVLRFEAALTGVTFASQSELQNPGRAECCYWLGVGLLDLDRPAEAAAYLKESADIYALRLGATAVKTMHAKEKLDVATRRAATRPSQPAGAPALGFALHPNQMIYCWRLGVITIQEGMPVQGVRWLRRALGIAKNNDSASQAAQEIEQLITETERNPWGSLRR